MKVIHLKKYLIGWIEICRGWLYLLIYKDYKMYLVCVGSGCKLWLFRHDLKAFVTSNGSDGSNSRFYYAASPVELLSNQSTNLTHDRAEINIGDRNTTVDIDNRVACQSDQFYRNLRNMKSSTTKLFFLLSHLAGLCYFVLDVEYFSVTGLVLVLLGTLLTACNYWLWLSPMNRVRDVSNLAWLITGCFSTV